jgi:general secretion pathway protein D
MIKPLDIRIRPIGISLALVAACSASTYAGSYGSSSSSLDSTAQREIVRRQQDILDAERQLQIGDRAMASKDYQAAYEAYMLAVDEIGSGSAVVGQRNEALAKFSQAAIAYAEALIDQGRYSDAEKVAKTILLPQYNPTYRPAVTLLSHLEQPDYYNKTVTPAFAQQREDVSKLLVEAEGFYSRGSYDLATKRYEQVLNIDKYNIAARNGLEKVSNAKQKYDHEAYNETRARMLWQVTRGWETPVRRFAGGKDTISTQSRSDSSQTEAIAAKLNRIIVPHISLQDTTIREAVERLRQMSRSLDTLEPDPAKKGVNIFLKLASANPSAGALPIGGDILPPPADATAAPGAAPAAAPAATEDTQVTLSLDNVPLYEVLRYLASLSGLKIKIDPVAVSIVPLSDVSSELVTKEYKVPPTFIPKAAPPAADTSGGFGAAVVGDQTQDRISKTQSAQTYLASLGVQFPEGASAQYIPAGSKLVVRNTQDNIDFIDTVVDAQLGAAPTQVQIESKFVEINQNNLKELGFDWRLGAFQIGSSGVYGSGGNATADSSAYPFADPSGQVIGSTALTSGLRTGQGNGPNSAVSINGIDALLGGASALASGAAPGILGIAGIYTNPQFQMVIRALNQKKGIDLMSAPTVTTKSGIRAVVNVIREFKYPTEFSPPQIPQSVGNTNGVIGSGDSGFRTSPIITPTTPSAFETRNLGVTLAVTPTVGADGYTIDLELAPEVVDFDGFINYGSPILSISANATTAIFSRPRSVEVSPNVINQPVFSTRKVSTSVTIWDGMTISIGGLMREDVQKVQDKVPLLGDIPLVGRLFRSDVDQKLKKNLIIFVTAKLIDAEGKPVRSDVEKEEIVEPLGLPDEVSPPVIDMKGPPVK